MDRPEPARQEAARLRARSTLGRGLKIGLLAFFVVVAAIVITVLLMGDGATLPFDYEGFD